MPELTYMDCWHYIAPLIPVQSGTISVEIYTMVFCALRDAEDRRRKEERQNGRDPRD